MDKKVGVRIWVLFVCLVLRAGPSHVYIGRRVGTRVEGLFDSQWVYRIRGRLQSET